MTAPDEQDVRLDDTLAFLQVIWRLDHELQTVSKRMQSELGLTGLQRLVLRLVGKNPGISAGHLARTLHLHPSTLTGVLDRLEGQKLLRRTVDKEDRRRALFRITAAGSTLLSRRGGTVEHAVTRLLAQEPEGRIATVRVVLDELVSILGRPGNS
ncbi:MAG: MarR family transcriptional regulator [Archangium sp.]|nr:MarR family transcriptional regulator [Archangium sp.]MDP3572446.1 MarR family transcriptional regulator [Archangium sp.]